MAVITTDEGNFVLGAIKGNREGDYIFYNDKDLDRSSDFLCGTAEDGMSYTEEQLKQVSHSRDAEDCVRLYIEIDDDIVTDKGGSIPATNFITALYNQSFVLYANEGITMMVQQILAWTTKIKRQLVKKVAFFILSALPLNVNTYSSQCKLIFA